MKQIACRHKMYVGGDVQMTFASLFIGISYPPSSVSTKSTQPPFLWSDFETPLPPHCILSHPSNVPNCCDLPSGDEEPARGVHDEPLGGRPEGQGRDLARPLQPVRPQLVRRLGPLGALPGNFIINCNKLYELLLVMIK